jgi:hypothetical protein
VYVCLLPLDSLCLSAAKKQQKKSNGASAISAGRCRNVTFERERGSGRNDNDDAQK